MRPNQPDERYLGSPSDFTFGGSPEDRKIVRKIQEDYARREGKEPVMSAITAKGAKNAKRG
jgi:hypothetical protein